MVGYCTVQEIPCPDTKTYFPVNNDFHLLVIVMPIDSTALALASYRVVMLINTSQKIANYRHNNCSVC
jgi:hypothetical protein